MNRRVFWHVGVPKSGTTFLQASLRANAKELRQGGVLHRGGGGRQFLAALDVTDQHDGWGRDPDEVRGSWQRLCEEAQGFSGDTVISHELFGAATPEQIERAAKLLDTLEIHVVVTVRDPARQVIAEWQEGVKHGRRKSFLEFERKTLSAASRTRHARRFRAAQDLPALLERWSSVVPADRLHVVTCPPSGGDPDRLWRRFCSAVDLDPEAYRCSTGGSNASLGAEQIALLREVNIALRKRLPQPGYGDVVKEFYAQEILPGTTGRRPLLPESMHPAMTELGEEWAHACAPFRIHGDLADLLPTAPVPGTPIPDHVDQQLVLGAAAHGTAELLLEVDRLRGQVRRLESELRDLQRVRKKLRALKRRLRPN